MQYLHSAFTTLSLSPSSSSLLHQSYSLFATPNNDFIVFTSTVGMMNSFFDTEFHKFRYVQHADREPIHRIPLSSSSLSSSMSEMFRLHPSLEPWVDCVLNVYDFPSPIDRFEDYNTPSKTRKIITGTLKEIRDLYHIELPTVSSESLSPVSQVIFQGVGSYFSRLDLQKYDLLNEVTYTNTSIIHGLNKTFNQTAVDLDENIDCQVRDCLIGNLQIQLLTGLTSLVGADITTYYDLMQLQDPYIDLSVKLLSLDTPPSVVVIGFGTMEALVHEHMMRTFSMAMMKIALRGVTVITNAGDSGVSGPLCWCDRGDGFFPMFPASVPFLTSVGGTMAYRDVDNNQVKERACQANLGSSITTGGGYSGYFPAPKYQEKSMDAYKNTMEQLDGHLSHRTIEAMTGRGYPDLSLLANDLEIVVDDVSVRTSSTGGSAIIFASMISLINTHRGLHNRNPVGFINPLLYQRGNEQYYPPQPIVISDDGESALCSANPLCTGLSGDCCPTAPTSTSPGVYLMCCNAEQPTFSPTVAPPSLFTDIINGSNACCSTAIQCCPNGYIAVDGWDPVSGLGSLDYNILLAQSIFYNQTDNDDIANYANPGSDDDDYGGRGLGFDRLNFLLGSIAMAAVFFLILEFLIENWSTICGEQCMRSCAREWRLIWRRLVRQFSIVNNDGDDTEMDNDEEEMIPIARGGRRGPQVTTTIAQ